MACLRPAPACARPCLAVVFRCLLARRRLGLSGPPVSLCRGAQSALPYRRGGGHPKPRRAAPLLQFGLFYHASQAKRKGKYTASPPLPLSALRGSHHTHGLKVAIPSARRSMQGGGFSGSALARRTPPCFLCGLGPRACGARAADKRLPLWAIFAPQAQPRPGHALGAGEQAQGLSAFRRAYGPRGLSARCADGGIKPHPTNVFKGNSFTLVSASPSLNHARIPPTPCKKSRALAIVADARRPPRYGPDEVRAALAASPPYADGFRLEMRISFKSSENSLFCTISHFDTSKKFA